LLEIIGIIVALGLALFLSLLMGAIFLRLACTIARVKGPPFLKAAAVAFVSDVASLGAICGAWLLVWGVAVLVPAPRAVVTLANLAIGWSAACVVSAWLHKVLLPTTFGKGALIWLIEVVFNFVVLAVIYGAFWAAATFTEF
jgi:hypothetical protein